MTSRIRTVIPCSECPTNKLHKTASLQPCFIVKQFNGAIGGTVRRRPRSKLRPDGRQRAGKKIAKDFSESPLNIIQSILPIKVSAYLGLVLISVLIVFIRAKISVSNKIEANVHCHS